MDSSLFSYRQMGAINVQIHGIGKWGDLYKFHKIARQTAHFEQF